MSTGSTNSNGGSGGFGVGVATGPALAAAQQGQGVAALFVMLAVLCFIFAYCCWGAPFCRTMCRRHCCCRLEDPENEEHQNGDQTMVATPTIILLPYGRTLVVDGTTLTQFQADVTGLDLIELGENIILAQRNSRTVNRGRPIQNSQCSIYEMDVDTPSKDSLGSIGCFPPPTYESIYGKDEDTDMPPSYSDILLYRYAEFPYEVNLRNFYGNSKEDVEMRSLNGCPHTISNPLSELTYHPGIAVTSLSSQSFPRRNTSRNSIISNPLDSFYMDNELDTFRYGNAIISRSNNNNNNTTNDNNDENGDDGGDGNHNGQNQSNRFGENRRAIEFDDMNYRNSNRGLSRRSREERSIVSESTTTTAASTTTTMSTSTSATTTTTTPYHHHHHHHHHHHYQHYREHCQPNETSTRTSQAEADVDATRYRRNGEPVLPDDEENNFNALTDIRESRV